MPLPFLISIVDDDDDIRVATSALVRALGYQAQAFASAEAFLESPEAEASDCLVVDVQMPGMSGPELQQALLRRPRRPPMVFMTAFPNAEVRKRVLAAGAIEVLGKPCDAAALSESIEAALASR